MSDNKVILFDLPRRSPNASWSPNAWKTRIVLNYKKIPYTTQWVEYPDIVDKLSSLGIPPTEASRTDDTKAAYTIPAVQLPDKRAVMDSAAIAPELEALKPEPSLHLDKDRDEAALRTILKLAGPLFPVFMPRIGRDVFLEKNLEYWYANRAKSFGMPVEEFERVKGGEPAWEAAKPGMEEMKEFLKAYKKDEGPFVLGSQVSYSDFVLVTMIEGLRRIGKDIFDRVIAYDESFAKLHEACFEWFREDQ